ncbi:MAG: DUF1007 family protein [Desulfobacteraceae bacterium]|nr:DUF1007 family protein [Desulfobacteraceae bacterium]
MTIIVALAAGVFWNSGPGAFAHPHVFIEERVKFEFDTKGLAGIRMIWTFDDMFSTMVAEDFDKNKNKALEPEEVADVKKGMFDNLVHYGYYAFVKIDAKPFEVKYVSDFKARLNKGILTYEFLIPCHVTAASQPKVVTLTSYDPDYYCALFFAEDTPTIISGDTAVEVSATIRKDMETSYYFGMVNPWQQRVSFRLKQ